MPQPKAFVLSRGGLAGAVLAFLLGKADRGWSQGSVGSLPSTLRQARGLAPAGYALHLLTILDRQQPDPQAQRAARLIAAVLDASYTVLDPSAITPLPLPVKTAPHARLLTLAGVVAVREGAAVVAAGMTGDPASTAEGGPGFVARFNAIAEQAGETSAIPRLQFITPFAGNSLADLVALGVQLGVPLESTWSCSAGFALQCGRCAACAARQTAFRQAGVPDQTRYGAPVDAPARTQGRQKGG